jgi:hypothetical protein
VKRRLLSLARRAHIEPPVYPPRPKPTPPPQEAPAEPQEPTVSVEDPSPKPAPAPKAEPPARVVHRTRKWYDSEPSRFSEMKF